MPENRSEIFERSFLDVPENYLYVKLKSKGRNNKVDTDNCSKNLIERSINHDKLYSSKIGLKIGKIQIPNNSAFHYLLKASSDLSYNFQDIKYVKSKFFMRHRTMFKSF